jgi:hypothetical protein
MREITLSFVRKVTANDPERVRDAEGTIGRLRNTWRASAGRALADRYADLYGQVDAEIETAKRQLTTSLPCSKGCDHCCRFNQILVSPYEAVLVVRHIEKLPEPERSAVVARIVAMPHASGGGSPCALLESSGCAVYGNRPLPCRGYYSLSEAACRARLYERGPDPATLLASRVVEFAALEVSQSAKSRPYEINALLRRIYSSPAKISQWAAGVPTDETDQAVR